jgi:chromosome partitioning protein
MVGMRVDPRTKTAIKLQEFLDNAGFPVMTNLRDAQVYMQAAEQGMSIFDMRPSLVKRDVQQWAPLLHWLVNG